MGKRYTLVVEDEEPVRNYLAMLLDEFDHECVAVSTAEEAHEAFDRTAFDLVILDQSLAGNERCKLVREFQAKRDVPVLLISGAHPEESAEELIRDGKAHFLMKPFRAGQIQTMLDEILG